LESEKVSEYWFMDYYRVLVISTGESNEKVVSVDVYRRTWPYSDYSELCVASGRYCLLYKELVPREIAYRFSRFEIKKIIVTGVRAGKISEVVNVRWLIEGQVSYSDLEELFYLSWKLIGCRGPLNTPWNHECTDLVG